MKLPSWSEINESTSNFEKKAVETIKEIKENHPLLDSTIQSLVSTLPPPINNVLLDVYNNASGKTPEEKFGPVMGYLKTLEFQGETHYNNTIEKLDKIISGDECLKEINEEQTRILKDIFVGQGENQQVLIDKLDSITTSLCKIETRLNDLEIGITPEHEKKVVMPKSFIQLLDKTLEENAELKNKPKEHIDLLLKAATAYHYDKQYERMFAINESVLAIEPNNIFAMNGIGIYFSEVKKDELKAIEYFDKAIAIKPDYHQAWNNRGVSLNILERYDEAVACYDKAIAIKPDDHDAWYNWGNSLIGLERYDEAVACYDKAIAIKPDKHQAWNNRGISLNHLERFEEAKVSYKKALELDPNNIHYQNTW